MDPWQLGWDALVAIGTLTLAAVTGVLAWVTSRMASKTSDVATETAEDVRSGVRPALIDAAGQAEPGMEFGGRNLDAPKDYGTLRVVVRNAGRGPALNVYGYVFVATKAFAKRTGLVTVGNVAPEESATVDILVAPNVDTSGSSQRCASSWVTRTLPVVGITPSFDSPIPAMVNADTATPIGNRSRRTEPRSATAKRRRRNGA